MLRRSIVLAICAYCVGLWFISLPVTAEPVITPNCSVQCLYSNGVLSVAIGQRVSFQISDSVKPIRDVIWTFGDGGKSMGFMATYAYAIPGKYMVEALVIYDGEVPTSKVLILHVVAAPSLSVAEPQRNMIFGLPTDIVYPVLAALATVLVYWLTGATI